MPRNSGTPIDQVLEESRNAAAAAALMGDSKMTPAQKSQQKLFARAAVAGHHASQPGGIVGIDEYMAPEAIEARKAKAAKMKGDHDVKGKHTAKESSRRSQRDDQPDRDR